MMLFTCFTLLITAIYILLVVIDYTKRCHEIKLIVGFSHSTAPRFVHQAGIAQLVHALQRIAVTVSFG